MMVGHDVTEQFYFLLSMVSVLVEEIMMFV